MDIRSPWTRRWVRKRCRSGKRAVSYGICRSPFTKFRATLPCLFTLPLLRRGIGWDGIRFYCEEFGQRVVMKVGVIGNDCGLPVRLMGVFGKEYLFTFVGVEDHLLGCAPIGDGGDCML